MPFFTLPPLPPLPPLSLYVHLPWCLQKCPYCDFHSHAIGTADLPEQRYLTALMADVEAALPLMWGRTVHSLFIGGGTPSLFSPQAIDQLLSGLRARLHVNALCEITLEANPGTFETDRFKAYRQAGITRLSIGVQSFQDEFLKTLGRVHDRAQALAAVHEAAQTFDTFNLDLMYALPGQTLTTLRQDVATALSLQPPHMSMYQLTLEPNTLFAKHPPTVADDDTAADMLDLITDLTGQAGLHRYEVSAYAKTGHACQHNLNYWQYGDYLGIGAGAHSKISSANQVLRQVRWRDPTRYMAHSLAGNAVAQENEVSSADLAFEFMLNALRLADGFDVQLFVDRTGCTGCTTNITDILDRAVRQGWVTLDGTHLQPTRRGFDFLSDLQMMFLPSEQPCLI